MVLCPEAWESKLLPSLQCKFCYYRTLFVKLPPPIILFFPLFFIMQQININSIYFLGKAISLITNISLPDYPLNFLHEVYAARKTLFEITNAKPLVITSQLSSSQLLLGDLIELLDQYIEKDIKSRQAQSTTNAGQDGQRTAEIIPYFDFREARDIATTAYRLEVILTYELLELPVYLIASPKRAYDVKMLLRSPAQAFPLGLLECVPEAKQEIEEFVKALACDMPNSCAFNLMRIFERVARKLLKTLSTDSSSDNTDNLGKVINDLEKLLENHQLDAQKEKNKLTDILRSIKDNYRNPVMHPEVNIDMEQVYILLGIVNGAISLILELMRQTCV